MSRRLSWFVLASLILVVIFLLSRQDDGQMLPVSTETAPLSEDKALPVESPPVEPPIGDQFLRNYGSKNQSAGQDLEDLGRVVEGFLLFFKRLDTRLASNNEDFSKLLRGQNQEGLIYVSPDSALFDDQKRIIDRWGGPIFFHPLATGIYRLRSAGPDRTLFTADDLVRGPETEY